MTLVRGALAWWWASSTTVFLSGAAGCEPAATPGLSVDGLSCAGGTLPADFTGLIVGVPFDHAFRVTDEAGVVVDVAAVFDDGSDPAMSLLRAPFATDDAWVVPFRVQPTTEGRVEGALVLTPADGAIAPCTVVLSATTG
jgi:hypothetical protein